jgi:hypothetical protein
MQRFFGQCRITVTGVDADYPQRVLIRVHNGGEAVIPGVVGAAHLVEAGQWELRLQHEVGGVWRENIRAVVGKWRTEGSFQEQVIRSKDVDWPGHSRIERNLLITLTKPCEGFERTPLPGSRDAAGERTRGAARPGAVATRSREARFEPGSAPAVPGVRMTGSRDAGEAEAWQGTKEDAAGGGSQAAPGSGSQAAPGTATSSEGYTW